MYRVYTCILSFVSSEADNYFTIKSPNSTNIRLTTPLTRSIANLKADEAWGGVRGQALQKFRHDEIAVALSYITAQYIVEIIINPATTYSRHMKRKARRDTILLRETLAFLKIMFRGTNIFFP